MKKTLIIPIILVGLTGCFGGSENTEIADITKFQYKTSNYSISLPQDWEIIEKNDFTSNIPAETQVVFRNNIKNEIFTANANISAKNVGEINLEDFAKNNRNKVKAELISFQFYEMEDNTIEIISGEQTTEGIIYEFSGKSSPSNPIIQFKQLYIVDGGLGFTITAAHLPNEDETVVKYLDEMLKSFTLN